MTEQTLIARIDMLTQAVERMAQMQGNRLSREELCARLGIHRSTLLRWLETDRKFPRPDKSGKWLLADIIRWESASLPDQ
jgi:predicted DNA-binding transcriptional regulator AlpA